MKKQNDDTYDDQTAESLIAMRRQHDGIIDDPNLVIDYDPMFANILGSSVDRRDFLKIGAAGMFAGAVPSARTFAAEKNWDPVVRIGYIPITDSAALLVAHELGFFKEQGIDSVRPKLIRGWSPLVEAFASHQFNLTHMLIPIPIWMRYNNKYPVKITAWDHTNGSAILVGKDSGINSPKDFGGKQFAVPYWYSIHNIVSQRIMKDAGITPVIKPQDAKLAPNECNFVVLAPPEMPPALAARSIDGYCVAEPFNALGEIKAGGKVLRFTGDVWKGHPCCVVVMHEENTEDPARAAWAQGVHNAVIKAQIHLAQNREEMAHMLSRDGEKYLPFPKEVVKRAMMFYDPAYYNNPLAIKHPEWGMDRINFQGWPYRSATELVVSDLKKTVITGDDTFLKDLSPQFVADDLVNYKYVKQALESNPGWKDDASVPKSGDPFIRTEVVEL